MEENWRYCTRPVCRLRSDRSRDRQIYTRRRRIIGDGKSVSAPFTEDPLDEEQGIDSGPPIPGRYCSGLCEVENEPVSPSTEGAKGKPSRG